MPAKVSSVSVFARPLACSGARTRRACLGSSVAVVLALAGRDPSHGTGTAVGKAIRVQVISATMDHTADIRTLPGGTG